MSDVTVRTTYSLKGEIWAPPSKAYTQRMLIAAALSHGTSRISEPLFSEDTEATLRAAKSLGARVARLEDCWEVEGSKPLRIEKIPIDCGESGATLRFMIPVAALADESSVFTIGHSLAKRPIEPLLQSLKQLGAKASIQEVGDKKVVLVEGGGISGGKTTIPGDVSSQFISGLMFACPMAQEETEITISTPLESKHYVQMTKAVLSEHGIRVFVSGDFRRIRIPPNQTYKPHDHKVPGDFSSAAFLFAAAVITHSRIRVNNLDCEIVQGDKTILHILRRMGAREKVGATYVDIEEKTGLLEAVEVNAADIPDLVPVCAALACYAKGTSRICEARRLQFKESNRLRSLHLEMNKMGAEIEADESGLTIKGPCVLHGATVDPHNDHRIAMACTVAAMGAYGNTIIQDAECVRKSYPRFFTDLQELGADIVGGKFDR